MDRRRFTLSLASAMACTICGRWVGDSAKAAGDRPHWTYEGPNGSDRWGQLDQSYLACGLGSQQSPVELAGAVRAELDPISIHWKSIRLDSVVNNGHTIQVNTPGAGYIELDGARFNLVQFHFHHMSEHTVEGKRYPIEVHFVHKAVSDDRLAVIGVFLVEGPENAVFNSIWTASPEREGEASSKAVIDATAMLPISSAAFRYAGSLTTPPCSEVVAWTVFNEPVSASADQIAFFAKQFPNNFRPTQPINRRVILFDG